MHENRTHCIRCGTCCMKGGPVLHHEDKKILIDGHAGHQHLITIRKGETAYNPVKKKLEPVPDEIVKVAGRGENWACFFYDEKNSSCLIYNCRFLECRLLKCWDPSEIMSVIGKDTIVRSDIINSNDPVLHVIETHEEECSYQKVETLISSLSNKKDKTSAYDRLAELVQKDLSIRSYALSELNLKKEYELFIFGRPLHKVLSDCGISVRRVR